MNTQHDRIKLLIVVPSLAGGGAERVVVYLLRRLDPKRFETEVALLRREGAYLDEVPDSVVIHDLSITTAHRYGRGVMDLARTMGRQRFDVVFAIMWHACVVTLAAKTLSRSKAAVLLNEQAHLSMVLRNKRFKRFKRLTVRRFYPRADGIYVVAQAVKEDMNRSFGIPLDKLHVIYNPVDVERARNLSREHMGEPWCRPEHPLIMAAGRLTEQKGFAHLVRAFARVRDELPCTLAILGEGPQKESLEKLGTELGLGKSLVLPGFQENPFKFMRAATLFVLSSLWEGLPLVLLEAMACGTPVVATRCPSGPEEIIEDGRSGLLVPPGDEDSLAEAMAALLKDETLRQSLSAAGKRRAEDFAVDKIVGQYENAFLEAAGIER